MGDTLPHPELARIILDESGYTAMWQADRTAEAAGRLENLNELVRAMEEYESPHRVPRACQPRHGQREPMPTSPRSRS
jgi:superfamily I DNA/RNA helicase